MADSQDAIELTRRARRRLVGAIALVVFAVIALPIVLDREPKPASQDLSIQIPSQDAGRFTTPVAPAEPPAPAKAAETSAVPAEAARVEIAKAEPAKSAPAKSEPVKSEPAKSEPAKAEAAKAEPAKPVAAKSEPAKAPAAKTDTKAAAIDTKAVAAKADSAAKSAPAETKSETKSEAVAKADAKSETKVDAKATATAAPKDAVKDTAKDAPKDVAAAEAKSATPAFVVALGLFSKVENVRQVRAKANAAGIKTFTEAVAGSSERVRVRAGPFPTRDAAEKARDKLKAAGLDVGAVATK